MSDNVIDAHVTPTAFGALHSRTALQADGDTLSKTELMPHDLSGVCWCQPVIEEDLLGGRIFIHRRTLDSPHIEVES